MKLRWVFVPLAVSAIAVLIPTVIGTAGGPGRGGGEGAPGWVFALYALAGVALVVFIATLCAWIALERRRS